MIYNVLITAVQQSDSVIHKYTFFFIFFSIMVYHRILSIAPWAVQKDLAYSFYIYQFVSADPKLPVRLTPMPHPLDNHSLLSVCECVSVSWTGSFVSYFRLHM